MTTRRPGRKAHPLAAVADLATLAFDDPAPTTPVITPPVRSPGSQISDADLGSGEMDTLEDLPPLMAELGLPSEFPQRSQSDMLVASHSRLDVSSIASLSSDRPSDGSSGARGSDETHESPGLSRRILQQSETLYFEPGTTSINNNHHRDSTDSTPTTVFGSGASGSRGSGSGSSAGSVGVIKKSVTTIGDSLLAPQSLESSLMGISEPPMSESRATKMSRRSRIPDHHETPVDHSSSHSRSGGGGGARLTDGMTPHSSGPVELTSRSSYVDSQKLRRTRRMEHRQVLIGLCQENDYLWKVIRGKDEIIKALKRDMERKDRILEDYEKRERESMRRMQSITTAPIASVVQSEGSLAHQHSLVSASSMTSSSMISSSSIPTATTATATTSGATSSSKTATSMAGVTGTSASSVFLTSSNTSLTPKRGMSAGSIDPSPEPRHVSPDLLDTSGQSETSKLQRKSSPLMAVQPPSQIAPQISGLSEVSATTDSSIAMTPHLLAATEVCRVRDGRSWLNDKYMDFRQVTTLVHRGDTSLFEASLGKVMIKRIPKRKLGCAVRPDSSATDLKSRLPETYAQEDPMMEIELTKKLSAMRPELLARIAGKDESLAWMVTAMNNFIKPYDLMSDDSWYWMAAPFIRGGDLHQIINDNPRMHLLTIKDYARQMVIAVNFLHQFCGFVHLDITPDNFLLDNSTGVIKLIDFGAARYIPDFTSAAVATGATASASSWTDVTIDTIQMMSEKRSKKRLKAPFPAPKRFTQPGKPAYRSPELHNCQAFDGISTDIWSLGVSIFNLVDGQTAWNSPDLEKDDNFRKMYGAFVSGDVKKKKSDISTATAKLSDETVGRVSGDSDSSMIDDLLRGPTVQSVVRSRNRDHFTPLCTDLLNKMLAYEPDERLDLNLVLSHDWFTVTEEIPVEAVSECDTAALLSGEIKPGFTSAISSGVSGLTEPSSGEEIRGLDSSSEEESSETPKDDKFAEIMGGERSSKLPPTTIEHIRRLGLGYDPSPAVTSSRTPSLSHSDLLGKLGGESPALLDLNDN